MTHIQLFNTNTKPMDELIIEAYKSFNVAPLGGASGDGWSKMNDFQRCPYRYWLLHEPKKIPLTQLSGETPTALALGSLFHSALAMHYMPVLVPRAGNNEYPTPFALLHRIESLGGNKDIVNTCIDLYGAYFNKYHAPHDEGMVPLGIEVLAGDPSKHTCRLDMVAKHNGGIWIVEHKTSSRETREVTEGWWLDGEILGEVYGWKLSGLDHVFGPLTGVLVNIVIKTTVPKFRRVEVVVTDKLLEAYKNDLAFWRGFRQSMRDLGKWPRKLNGCIGRYGMCEFWDHCRDADSTDDERLNRMLQLSIGG